jgi:hypothetical protein
MAAVIIAGVSFCAGMFKSLSSFLYLATQRKRMDGLRGPACRSLPMVAGDLRALLSSLLSGGDAHSTPRPARKAQG